VAEYTISEVEAGKRTPRPSTLRKLAQGLNVEVADLYGEPEYPLGEAPPDPQQSFNGLLEEERRSRFAEIISTATDKWAATMTAPDTDPKIVSGVVDAVLGLHAVIRTFLEDEERRQALTNEEGDEIIAVLQQLHETASVGVRRLEEAAEDAGQEQEAKRMREQIRRWTNELSA
jgi:transcriptional regulator with XRE-family HTH domain